MGLNDPNNTRVDEEFSFEEVEDWDGLRSAEDTEMAAGDGAPLQSDGDESGGYITC